MNDDGIVWLPLTKAEAEVLAGVLYRHDRTGMSAADEDLLDLVDARLERNR